MIKWRHFTETLLYNMYLSGFTPKDCELIIGALFILEPEFKKAYEEYRKEKGLK